MDADSDMDVNNGQAIEIDAKNAKIEWEVLKKYIQDELALVTAQLKEFKKAMKWRENENNIGCTLKVEPDIYTVPFWL